MFFVEDMKCLDRRYFEVFSAGPYEVSIMSRNTGHYWVIKSVEYPNRTVCIILHKHRFNQNYHHHKIMPSLRKAVGCIRRHDEFQLNGRRPVRRNRLEKTA